MNQIRVFFFGDSICVGQHVSIHNGWVAKISASLAQLGKEKNWRIVTNNASANGRTTRQALEVIGYELQSQHPDIVIVQFGMNDCNYWQTDKGLPRVSPKAFGANLEEIIRRSFNFGAKTVLLNTNHPTGLDQKIFPHTDIVYQQSNEQYNQIIRNVAKDNPDNLILNDIESHFVKHTGKDRDKVLPLLMEDPDLLHLSEKGHELYFELVYPKLESAVLDIINAQNE